MKITLLTVGRIKEKYFTDAVKEYSRRLSRYLTLNIEEAADESVPERAAGAVKAGILKKEGDRLLNILGRYPHSYVIALAIDGRMYDSVELSRHLSELQVRGCSHFVFIIGGSLGLSEDVLKRSDERISFSRLTFPHQLMRVIALEQIYRAVKIEHGEPYHK